uniref:Isoleucine--tRNA ligase, cytoplasmic n=1 Tax=Hemiscolopendra marginata TaxID=943146 RepID=A0A646QD90_9MYRI
MASPVPENIDFAKEEESILKRWKELDVFKTSLKQSTGKPRYSFYDGPPFATGLPHYGHILAGTIKDIVTRYAHQNGFHVERRFGWDCHGLPVEYEIDKNLNIRSPQDVMKLGIENYNKECRKIVTRYSKEWEEIVTRLGRWIDFENDYKTMYPTFMESVWWVFKELYVKGLVYRGFKVMPFSTVCNTPLSNFECGQNYKEVVDPAVIIGFPLDEEPEVSMIAWTTTPWTLPSNLSLCVNPEKDYVKVKDNSTNNMYIMMEARLEALFKKPEEYLIIAKFPGKSLFGKTYKPLFPYFAERKKTGAFRILCDDYVTEESGTGVVHQAPYFGEDDFRICLAAGIIQKDGEIACPVDESGRFTDPVSDFKNEYVKDADKNIIKWLKSEGRLVHNSTVKHSYPFCWRSDSPLIYKAVPSWFIRVEQIVDKLLENNSKTYWVPEYVKEKRFANWLRDARDWAVSRNRYWGTPIPIWTSEDGEEIVCIGSRKELEEMTGQSINDLHREFIDKLTIPSTMGKGKLYRVPEVFDCWFESGSMPYAQVHYPFENKNVFEDSFPADFIAEGIDQTRGWFYTLLVLSTALFGKPPFKNLICNGLVLASDGQKMSKRKKNYPDPMDIVHKYGADALRLYLITSPAVRGDNLRFKEEGVRDILKDVFLPWYNAYRFFVQNVNRLLMEEETNFVCEDSKLCQSKNIMDKWILSCTQSLLLFVKKEMSLYRLYTVVPTLIKFIDNLTNWYVRFNRKRLKGEGGNKDCTLALETLFSILLTLTKVMAPFTPYLTELMYLNLSQLLHPDKNKKASVHYLMLPDAQETFINREIEQAVSKMQTVIELGRIIRDRKTLPIKYPLLEIIVVHKDENCLKDIRSLEKYILEELNIKKLTTTTEKEKYGIQMRAEPDHKTLGARLRADFKKVTQAIKQLPDEEIQQYLANGSLDILGHTIGPDELRIMYTIQDKSSNISEKYEAHSDNDLLVMLDVTPDQSLVEEGLAREVINRIQKLRKKAHLVPSDPVIVYYEILPATDSLSSIVKNFQEYIEGTIKASLQQTPYPLDAEVIIKEQQTLKGVILNLTIVKRQSDLSCKKLNMDVEELKASGDGDKPNKPFSKFVDIHLHHMQPQYGATNCIGTVLLENPLDEPLNYEGLVKEVSTVFGLQGNSFELRLASDPSVCLLPGNGGKDLTRFHQDAILIAPSKDFIQLEVKPRVAGLLPHCHFVNVEFHYANKKKKATVLLENPKGNFQLNFEKLKQQITNIFSIREQNYKIFLSSSKSEELSPQLQLCTLHGKTLYIEVN